MAEASLVDSVRKKYQAILADLDERGRRRWAAAKEMSLGCGKSPLLGWQPESQTESFGAELRN